MATPVQEVKVRWANGDRTPRMTKIVPTYSQP